jgi:hypothetical protein
VNLSTVTVLWLGMALLGMAFDLAMLFRTLSKRKVAGDRHERRIVWGDVVQWGLGVVVYGTALWLGIWMVFMLPPTGTPPEGAIETFASKHGRTIIQTGLLLKVFVAVIRDAILVVLDELGRRIFRREILAGTNGGRGITRL